MKTICAAVLAFKMPVSIWKNQCPFYYKK